MNDVINTNDLSGADGFKMAVSVCVTMDRCDGSCDTQSISVAIDVSDTRIWVASFEFDVSQDIPTSEVKLQLQTSIIVFVFNFYEMLTSFAGGRICVCIDRGRKQQHGGSDVRSAHLANRPHPTLGNDDRVAAQVRDANFRLRNSPQRQQRAGVRSRTQHAVSQAPAADANVDVTDVTGRCSDLRPRSNLQHRCANLIPPPTFQSREMAHR